MKSRDVLLSIWGLHGITRVHTQGTHESFEVRAPKVQNNVKPSNMEEVNRNIATIFEQNIPSGKKALQDSHKNLAEIADYCERQYISVNNTYKSNDKTKALEETRAVFAETKQYATQSLASVAYQIHALAASVLDLLDNQASQLSQMNSDISYISNVVHVHKEKVARREIGVLASSKNTTRGHKIIAPSQREQPKRYQRQPIDYNALDAVGHGSKSATAEPKRNPSVRSNQRSTAVPNTPTAPPTAPKAVTTGTLRVRTKNQPPPSAPPPPPEVPKIPNGGYPPPSLPNVAPPPPPMINPPGSPVDLPPPPPPIPADLEPMSPGPPPPPPMTLDVDGNQNALHGEFSPLPPPPPPMPDADPAPALPAWVPENYEEKVVSIYDYEATRDDELSFKEGEIIYVLKKNSDGWYEGVLDGMTGLFPGNYVEITL
ncbi:abl interactor 1-like isoform X2 [Dendronephthya gigantea]|uniref:abl interactor 1-like isoform X2 n=1 Tax=Dendronephthya gigantea TaxID=151771 RepID=UPI00106B4115|nr:abl interactor 1-like isoform X2 [Dendronephthya gigantea]